MQEVRDRMGVCPQHNVLFDQLTVREHLEVFRNFRINGDGNEFLEKLMRDIDLSKHADKLAKDLSGGNKRKLCVALALVADSRLVLLDEPTSGMDLTARRRLWDMLKRYREGRIIILTTHNMEEAELLGDRVAIMKAGRIVCDDKVENLKSRLSFGFYMRVVLSEEIISKRSILAKLLTLFKDGLGDNVALVGDDGLSQVDLRKVRFTIPREYEENFAAFFAQFDEIIDDYYVLSYDVRRATLEDVFLQFVDDQLEGTTIDERNGKESNNSSLDYS